MAVPSAPSLNRIDAPSQKDSTIALGLLPEMRDRFLLRDLKENGRLRAIAPLGKSLVGALGSNL